MIIGNYFCLENFFFKEKHKKFFFEKVLNFVSWSLKNWFFSGQHKNFFLRKLSFSMERRKGWFLWKSIKNFFFDLTKIFVWDLTTILERKD